jgi:transcriptional regulator
MYSPRAFVETDLAALDALVARDPFATLITVVDGAPCASHLPVLYARNGERVVFRGHWARPNPQWRNADGREATLIVHGPHTYISPSWYPDKEFAARVPTWNYAIAHVSGVLKVSEDPVELAGIVSDLAERHETAIGSDWRFPPEREDYRVQLKGIVGFSLEAARIELKFKFNQNHPVANVLGAADALERQDNPLSHEVAALMRDHLGRRHSTEN